MGTRQKALPKETFISWNSVPMDEEAVMMSDVFHKLAPATLPCLARVGEALLGFMHRLGAADTPRGSTNEPQAAHLRVMRYLCETEGKGESLPGSIRWTRLRGHILAGNIVKAMDGRLGLYDNEAALAFVESTLSYQFIVANMVMLRGTALDLRLCLTEIHEVVIIELLRRGLYEDRAYMAKLTNTLWAMHHNNIVCQEGYKALDSEPVVQTLKNVCFARGWVALTEGL